MIKQGEIIMSMKSMIQGKGQHALELIEILKSTLPDKTLFKTISGSPAFSQAYSIKVPYELSESYYSTVVGTAFDFMVRFLIAKKLQLQLGNYFKQTAAYKGLMLMKNLTDKKTFDHLAKRFDKCSGFFKNFLISDSFDLENSLEASCAWARFEQVARSGGVLPENMDVFFKKDKDEIIQDLGNLCTVFKDAFINTDLIKKESNVVFNPTFGLYSMPIGGADADIFIDGTLYDLKTGKSIGYKWQEVAQIIGYFILHEVSKYSDFPGVSLAEMEINRIAFYRARYGVVEYVDISDIDVNKLDKAIADFSRLFKLK
jgi:hypothetical protein